MVGSDIEAGIASIVTRFKPALALLIPPRNVWLERGIWVHGHFW